MIRGMRSRHSEMPIPTRTAPKPPGNLIDQRNNTWSNNDPFGPLTIHQPVQKKKPPPRPPPPRIKKDNIQNNLNKSRKPTRPTELITNLFGMRSAKQPQIKPIYFHNRPSSTNGLSSNSSDGTVSLIDLSPPGSPTFTIRSSSDGVSIDSFGSDGNSNPSVLTSSSGNTSQNESAFEDDFDFFGSLSKQPIQNDPWKQNLPFDSLLQKKNTVTNTINGMKHNGEASFISYNNDQVFTPISGTNNVSTMPTIIRARPPKPPAPKLLTTTSLAPTVPNFNIPSGVQKAINSSCTFNENLSWSTATSETLSQGNSSPPMPSIPPPAPPPEYLTQIECPVVSVTTQKNTKPHGIAMYDFEATQSGDLSLKEGDTVYLTKKINDEWLEGRIGNQVGMFPANFVEIIVPLEESSSNIVNALYTFNGETWEDLNFEEGAKIRVLSKISDDWLYGEYQGKKGQFPTNFVDRLPCNLPKYL